MRFDDPTLQVRNLSKTFIVHPQGGLRLPVLQEVDLTVHEGECVALSGPSGCGKSTLIRCLYGSYVCDAGEIHVRHGRGRVDLASASAREILKVRHASIGYVSQFMQAVPRVPTLELVADPLIERGGEPESAYARAREMLMQLGVSPRLWDLPPATFSGGEQQRVNIATGLIDRKPILLMDEPTASLDAGNAQTVIDLIRGACAAGSSVVVILHDTAQRRLACDREIHLPAPIEQVATG